MTTRIWIAALVAGSAVAVAACNFKGGSGAAPAKPPVATVNGQPISAAAFAAWVEASGVNKKPEELSGEQRKQLLENIESLYIAAQEAEKQNVAADPEIAARVELQRMNVLVGALVEKYTKEKAPTDAELRAEYDKQIGAAPKAQYHASHILVKEEALAKDIIAQLGKGAKFEALAKKYSIDTASAKDGGDLKWFRADQMVKPFSDAVEKLAKGQVTKEPVQTQFGWHVIRLEDSKELTPPPFEAVKERVGQIIKQRQVHDYIESLRKAAKIDEAKVEEKPAAPAAPTAGAAPAAPAAPAASAAPASPAASEPAKKP
jgi:peptidyl-prolyl cis-trans isomerase C